MLQDSFGRKHDYLRISLTDVCNFRCVYCMPAEGMHFMPPTRLMQANEIIDIATEFVKLGVTKIRLTGGEPLVRKDAADIILQLSKLPVELTLSTNATRVDEFIDVFKQANIKSINVSLDTLNKEKFHTIAQRNSFDKVWSNINLLVENNFHVKINAVIMRGINETELNDFVALTQQLPVHVRFIEFMPFTGNKWNDNKVFSYQQMLDVIATKYTFIKLKDEKHDTTKKFKVLNHAGTFAVISTMSAPFCAGCNRLRLTADGKMKNCLFSKGEADILSAYRKGEDFIAIIKQCVHQKEKELGGQFTSDLHKVNSENILNRSMISIGG
ncbi:MAG: GTP 3',8-cyclase MoaA [Bacteroidetes bacterium]|nr:GTP 3',8-cyclase MoaA [Bacteroidota bacterium]